MATMAAFAGQTMKSDFAKKLAGLHCEERVNTGRAATKTAVSTSRRVICAQAISATRIGRSSFPKGFVFGAGTSAYQVEGAAAEGGRGPSIWDTFTHIPGKIADGSTGDVAIDQYHRYKEDVQHMKYLGLDSYRFSISWTRIFPKGKGDVNQEGVDYYNNLINELIDNGIEPFVTLYHWDMPQTLEDEYGGLLSDKVVEDFAAYAEECFKQFGDRVKYWATINEPWTVAMLAYTLGVHAPGHCSPILGNCMVGDSATEPYIVTHNMLLMHSAAVKIYKSTYQESQKGSIGIVLGVSWGVPFLNASHSDRDAAQRFMDFTTGWYMDPLTRGNYPASMRSLVGARLPSFTLQQSKDLAGSFDYIGYNYYVSQFVVNNPSPVNPLYTSYSTDFHATFSMEMDGIQLGEAQEVDEFRSYPAGLGEILHYTKIKYNNPPIYITETGYAGYDDGTTPLHTALIDLPRVKYHQEHLSYVLRAIRDGSDIRGYTAWSMLDNFEWSSGFPVRFGLYYVDQTSGGLERYPRTSAHWYREILKK